MAITRKSTVGEIASIPGIEKVLEKYFSVKPDPSMISMAAGYDIETAATYMGMNSEILDKMIQEINEYQNNE